jgi:hypothetical protein
VLVSGRFAGCVVPTEDRGATPGCHAIGSKSASREPFESVRPERDSHFS